MRWGVGFFFLIGLSCLIITPESDAQYYFGRNKIQYNNFQWQILRTEHFDIYFYPEMAELAEIGASYAEEAFEHLQDKFHHTISRRIPLIFYSNHSHFQQTNTIPWIIPEGVGGFFEFLKGRVVIPANGSIPQFRHVIRHELVHVFTHSKVNRVLKDHRRTSHPGPPLWFTEGIAEYWAGEWNSQSEMFIRDAVLNNHLVPLTEMYRINGTFLMYKEGESICKFVSDEFGPEKLLQLMENIWKEEKFSSVMKLTIDLNYREFDERWAYHLKKQMYPLLEELDSPSMASRKITRQGINAKPVFTRIDGEPHVVFVGNRSGYTSLYLKSLDKKKQGKKPELLIQGERTADFEAFHLLRSKIDVNDAGVLAFASKSGEHDVLYLYDLNERKVLSRFDFPDVVSMYSPAWSPDNSSIAFSAIDFGGMSDLYIVDTRTGDLTRLTQDFYDDRDPAWTRDGKALAFSSDRGEFGSDGFYNLFLVDREGRDFHYLTHDRHNDYAPVWSPKGKYLTFSSDRNGAFNIWVVRKGDESEEHLRLAQLGDSDSRPGLVGFNQRLSYRMDYPSAALARDELKQVTHFTTGALDPAWTDDGSLLFTAFEKFSFQIRTIKDLEKRFDEAERARVDSIGLKMRPWQVARIPGEMETTTLRYKRRFSLDIAQSQVTQDPIFGRAGGAQFAMSDMLGNQQYYFLIYNNAGNRDEFLSSFNVAVTRVDLSRRANVALGAFHLAGRYYSRADGFFYERRYGGFGAVSYPISRFRRFEANLNVRNSDKEWYGIGYRRKALLVSNFGSYIKDNSLWGPSGPVDGERYNITVGNTVDVQHSNVGFYTVIADYRRYFRLSQRVSHAVRVLGEFNIGKEALPFFMGGSWDLRGYDLWSIWGRRLFLVSNELRFPFIDNLLLRFPFGGMAFSAIRGAAFVDAGNAWDEDLENVLGSVGLGVRFRLGGVLVLRFDVGRRFALSNPNRFYDIGYYDLEKKVFRQFFFGWDF